MSLIDEQFIGWVIAVYKPSKQKPVSNATVANRCHFTLTSKNKCLSGQAALRMIDPLEASLMRGMAAAET
jgi:hypothetical protein